MGEGMEGQENPSKTQASDMAIFRSIESDCLCAVLPEAAHCLMANFFN
jgi:hypothetical protein